MFQSYVQQQAALSPAEAAEICRRTLGQAENPDWVKERTGRLTASNFFRIVHCVKPEGLIKSILYPKKETLLNPLDPRLYGRQNEAVAVEAYRSLMHLYDKDVEILETGLHALEEYPILAASPDRIIRDGNEVGLLEVKCPASKAGQAVRDACQDIKFCAELVNGEVQLKRTHPYYIQVQGQLAITKKLWCDFVLWTGHPELHLCVCVECIYF
ncbi:hypothetical protein MTO96_011447 [Rhipicephalus appendiculatus]